jgi:hypothetical protein
LQSLSIGGSFLTHTEPLILANALGSLPALKRFSLFEEATVVMPGQTLPTLATIHLILKSASSLCNLAGSFELDPRNIPADNFLHKSITSINLAQSFFMAAPSIANWEWAVVEYLTSFAKHSISISMDSEEVQAPYGRPEASPRRGSIELIKQYAGFANGLKQRLTSGELCIRER